MINWFPFFPEENKELKNDNIKQFIFGIDPIEKFYRDCSKWDLAVEDGRQVF